MIKEEISWFDFEKIDVRVGTILEVQLFPEAKKPAYQVWVDLGEILGVKKSSAQITDLYAAADLLGKQVIVVVNFPPKQIANFMSECLILGVYNAQNEVVLLQPDRLVENGSKIG